MDSENEEFRDRVPLKAGEVFISSGRPVKLRLMCACMFTGEARHLL